MIFDFFFRCGKTTATRLFAPRGMNYSWENCESALFKVVEVEKKKEEKEGGFSFTYKVELFPEKIMWPKCGWKIKFMLYGNRYRFVNFKLFPLNK